ncbi:hypothetical protein EI94DRAFT_1028646 [Lactarius quietus]|nr:hypothetical protein EI94DRAFT_1028646 [Lactarius quietus]
MAGRRQPGKALSRVARSEQWSRRRSRHHRIEESVPESSLPSLDSSNITNSSSLPEDSQLRAPYTTNTSFISTDSSLQSYYTPNASVSTINSTSSCSSDVSFPYTVTSINSYKSRKTVLYRRREHPPPAAISSQVRLLLQYLSLFPNKFAFLQELSETPHLV